MILSKSISSPRYAGEDITELDLYSDLHVISESVVRVFHEIGKNVNDSYTSDIEAYRSYVKDVLVFLDKRQVFVNAIYRQNYITLQNIKNKFNAEIGKVISYFNRTNDGYNITIAKFNAEDYEKIPNFEYMKTYMEKNLKFNVKEAGFKNQSDKLQATLNTLRGKSIGMGSVGVDAFYKKMEGKIKYETETFTLNKDSVTELMKMIEEFEIDKNSFDHITLLISRMKEFFEQCLYYTIEDVRELFPNTVNKDNKIKDMYAYTDYKFRIFNAMLSYNIDAYNYKTKVMYDALRICIDNTFKLKDEKASLSECSNTMSTVSNYRRCILEMNRLLEEYDIYHDKGYNFNDMYALSEQVLKNRKEFTRHIRENIITLENLFKSQIQPMLERAKTEPERYKQMIHNAGSVATGKLSTMSQTYVTPSTSEMSIDRIMADYEANHSCLYKDIDRISRNTIMDIQTTYINDSTNLEFIINKIVKTIPNELLELSYIIDKFESGVSAMINDSMYSDLIQDKYNNLLSVMVMDLHQQGEIIRDYGKQLYTYLSRETVDSLIGDTITPTETDFYVEHVLNTENLKDADRNALLAMHVKYMSLWNAIVENFPFTATSAFMNQTIFSQQNLRLQEAKLSTQERKELPDTEYGLPDEKKYPLTDRQHVIKAIQFFHHCPDNKKSELAHRIKKKADEFDVEIKNTEILEYLHLRESVAFKEEEVSTAIYGMDYMKYITEMNLITQAKMNFVYTILCY